MNELVVDAVEGKASLVEWPQVPDRILESMLSVPEARVELARRRSET